MRPALLGLAALAAAATIAGCSARYYRQQADRDVYQIIARKQQQTLGQPQPFDVEPNQSLAAELERRNYDPHLPPEAMAHGGPDAEPVAPPVVLAAGPSDPSPVVQLSALFAARPDEPPLGQPLENLPPATQPELVLPTTQPAQALARQRIPAITGAGELYVEPGDWPPYIQRIDLVTALQLAAINNREFQSAKETVYLSALSLTGQRYVFENQFFGTVEAGLEQPDQDVRTGFTESRLGFTRNFATGGAMALSVTNRLFEVFTDPTGKTANSTINLALSQPVLRGAGYRVALEPLVQADRNVIYSVRTFERFKRELAVTIATEFYNVLELGDAVVNERNNYANLILGRERTEEMSKAGRLPEFQLDQARQDELRARNRWVVAIQRYNQALDRFRRTLGVPVDWPIVPDPDSLRKLAEGGLNFQVPDPDAAVQRALENRLDLKNVRDQVVDASRKVYVARDALRMGLDLGANIQVFSNPEMNKPADFRFEHGDYSVGMLLDLPLDRLEERNVYRATLIEMNRRQRDLVLQVDDVTLQVRTDIRNLVQAQNVYHIQESALKLARRRVESTTMLLQAGRASTRDMLEAQAALVEAQNAVTTAIVDYQIARLELLRDMETLQVEPAGLTYYDPTAGK